MDEHEIDLKEAASLSLSLAEYFEQTEADPYVAYVAMQLLMLQMEETLKLQFKKPQED